MKKYLVLAIVATLTCVGLFYLYIFYTSGELPFFADAPVPENPSTKTGVEEIQILVQSGKYRDAIQESHTLLAQGESLSPNDLIIASDYLLQSIQLANTNQKTPQAKSDHILAYTTFYNLAQDTALENEIRAALLARINIVFQISLFDSSWFVEAFKEFQDGNLYEVLIADPSLRGNEAAIAYTALYDVNEGAAALTPDKFIASWQTWLVAVSVLNAPPPPQLEEQFMAYFQQQFTSLPSLEYTIPVSSYQLLWIEQALLLAHSRLTKLYPESFTLTLSDINNGFQDILLDSKDLDPIQGGNNLDYITRISYASAMHRYGLPAQEILPVLEPLQHILVAEGVTDVIYWIKNGVYANDTVSDASLYDLYTISAHDPELKSTLEALNWEY